MTISERCIAVQARFMTSIGQGLPAIMPVRSGPRSNLAKSGWSISAMNIVGTPYTAVHRSSAIALRVASGSKPSLG
jgi:hypothetical protein